MYLNVLQLTPVERYAVCFMELEMDPVDEAEMGEVTKLVK